MKAIERIAIIGFGEVGGIFGGDFAQNGLKVAVTDILLRESSSSAAMRENARRAGVSAHELYKDAIAGADVVISAVTSSSSVDAATTASPLLEPDQIYLDINSVSPEKKREIARIIGKSKAKFVEAAVMAPVSPQRLKVPMLLGGPDAHVAADRLTAIGMNAKADQHASGRGFGDQDVPQRAGERAGGAGGGMLVCGAAIWRGDRSDRVAGCKLSVDGLEQFPSRLSCEPRGAAWAPARGRDARSS